MYDFAIIGGGIVGLATGMSLGQRYPDVRIVVLEGKQLAFHQTATIWSFTLAFTTSQGVSFCQEGSRSMVDFARNTKLLMKCVAKIVATETKELLQLENLYKRGLENGLNVTKISAEKSKKLNRMYAV